MIMKLTPLQLFGENKMNSPLLSLIIIIIIIIMNNNNNNSVQAIGYPDVNECHLISKPFGYVCKCTAEYCDYLPEQVPSNQSHWLLISSSKNGLRFSIRDGYFGTHSSSVNITDYQFNSRQQQNGEQLKFFYRKSETLPLIKIERNRSYQKIVGFGGAFTGAVSFLLQDLPQQLQNHIYKSYFHKDGINYNMMRYTIGGCDFDLMPWAYNEVPANDMELSNFTKLDQRDFKKIEQIKRLKEIASKEEIKIMAAAWSPPPWMKTNGRWTGYSQLKPQYYQTWANYHLRFIELMNKKNLPIWAISTGNEPLNGIIGWFFIKFMSLGWLPSKQAIYLNDHLGPVLRNSSYKSVLIFGNDDQRYTFPRWFKSMNSTRKNVLDYLDGLAVHWYWDEIFGPELIDKTVEMMPEKLLINTESCMGAIPWETRGPKLGSWSRSEAYARALIQDLQHNFNGWIDWNLILNEFGGPNYANNFVDAPIIVNTTGEMKEIYKQPIFYTIGHFSKFISPGSKRIYTFLKPLNRQQMQTVGFQRPDGYIVVIIFNEASIEQDVCIDDDVRGQLQFTLPPHSIHTLLYM